MKRISALLIILCLLLAGCGCKHDWEEATCRDPRTCRLCGEIEGEVLGHDYQAATCTQGEICLRCGKERGDALGHTPAAPANYQRGEVCETCHQELRGPLTPAFEEHGLECTMEVGVPVTYVTSAKWNDTKAVGEAVVHDFQILTAEDRAELARLEEVVGLPLELRDGYEWRVMYAECYFPIAQARANQFVIDSCTEDYYNIHLFDDNVTYDDDGRAETLVSWYGQEYPIEDYSLITEKGYDYDRQVYYFNRLFLVQVPQGYDGMVFGFMDSCIEWPEGKYIYDLADENTVFFRLK